MIACVNSAGQDPFEQLRLLTLRDGYPNPAVARAAGPLRRARDDPETAARYRTATMVPDGYPPSLPATRKNAS